MKFSAQETTNTAKESRAIPGRVTFNRRSFVKRAFALGAAANSVGLLSGPGTPKATAAPGPVATTGNGPVRRQEAFRIRQQAALLEFTQPLPDHPNNGDEALYSNRIGNFSKGL